MGHSALVYEDDLHVPLVFLHPALQPAGRIVDIPAAHVDLYPTLLDLLGLEGPESRNGVSLAKPIQCSLDVRAGWRADER